MTPRLRARLCALSLALAPLAPAPLVAQGLEEAGCDPEVMDALKEAGAAAADQAYKKAAEFIKEPGSVLDLSCLGNLSIPGLSFGLDFDSLLDSMIKDLQNQICSAAQDAWNKTVTAPLNSVYDNVAANLNQIPGARVSRTSVRLGNLIDPATGAVNVPFDGKVKAPRGMPYILVPSPDGKKVEIKVPELPQPGQPQ